MSGFSYVNCLECGGEFNFLVTRICPYCKTVHSKSPESKTKTEDHFEESSLTRLSGFFLRGSKTEIDLNWEVRRIRRLLEFFYLLTCLGFVIAFLAWLG